MSNIPFWICVVALIGLLFLVAPGVAYCCAIGVVVAKYLP